MADANGKVHLMVESIELVDWYIEYLKEKLPDYDLPNVTNERVNRLPNVLDVHPLAMETGTLLAADDPNSYNSVLPAIGVEMQADPEVDLRIGAGRVNNYKITQDWLDIIKGHASKAEAYAEGDIVANSTIEALQDAITAVGANPLWAEKTDIMRQPTISVSVWSDDPQVTRILYKFVLAILHRSRKDLQLRGVATTITGQASLYNFDFGRMMVGAEISITPRMLMRLLEVQVTSPTSTLSKGELHYPENLNTDSESTTWGPKFVARGESDAS